MSAHFYIGFARVHQYIYQHRSFNDACSLLDSHMTNFIRSFVNESKLNNELNASHETLFQTCELFFLYEIFGKVLRKRDKFLRGLIWTPY